MKYPLTMFFIASQVASSPAQDSLWTLVSATPTQTEKIKSVQFLAIQSDSLKIACKGETFWIPMSSISGISRGEGNVWGGRLIGALGGVGVGFTTGWVIDNSRRGDDGTSMSTDDTRLTAGVTGLLIGGLLGNVLGSKAGVDHLEMSELTTGEKLVAFERILRREGGEVPPGGVERDVVYLTNGSTVRGTILAISEGDGIRLRSGDGTTFLINMSNVRRFMKAGLPSGVNEEDIGYTRDDSPGWLTPSRFAVSFYAGLGFPVGDFGEANGLSAGGANAGYCFGAAGSYDVSKLLFWQSDVTVCANRSSAPGFPDYNGGLHEPGSWLLVWGLTGIGASSRVSSDLSLRAVAQFGVLIGESPAISVKDGVRLHGPPKSAASSLAFGFGVGVRVREDFGIDVKVLHSSPEYGVRKVLPYNSFGPYTFVQPTSLVCTVVSYRL